MNRAFSLDKLIDEAKYLQDESTKNLTGSITRSEDFVRNARVLESLKQVPNFPALALKSEECVAAREKLEGAEPPSEPQLYIGGSVAAALQQYAFPAH